jgi:hypothetical protein
MKMNENNRHELFDYFYITNNLMSDAVTKNTSYKMTKRFYKLLFKLFSSVKFTRYMYVLLNCFTIPI